MEPHPGSHLLVASTGGHLAQLVKWSQILESSPESLWITFKSPQSESLLINRRVLYVPYVSPRDLRGTASAFIRMMREINWSSEKFTSAITTGAAVGLAGLTAARAHRIPSFYFESVSRVNGPSLTGRIASINPRIQAFCQYEHWAGRRWIYRSSLFDTFETVPKPQIDSPSLFVTLGTIFPYRFDALVDKILATGLADDRTVWQLGCTTRHDLPGKSIAQMSAAEFDQCAQAADVVITHAGVGTIMHLLELGIHPLVVPRRAKRNEHVDDHQVQISALLAARKLSAVFEIEEIESSHIVAASGAAVTPCGKLG